MKLLVADIGGTRSRFYLFKEMEPLEQVEYSSRDFKSFADLLKQGRREHPEIFEEGTEACFALPGLGDEEAFKITNLPWTIVKTELQKEFGFKKLIFLNDLQASAYGVDHLPSGSFLTLQEGVEKEGPLAIISPGTGLGEAFLSKEGKAFATESGHVDFAPVTDLQYEMAQFLKKKFGRVSYEHLLSGIGIWNIYSFLEEKHPEGGPITVGNETPDKAQAIWNGAFKYHHHLCIESLRLFTQILAQEAGNLALHTLATRGVYIGGGIAHYLQPYLQECTFLDTFCQKGPMTSFLKSIPVKMVLDQRSSPFGCAWYYRHGTH